ncbi:MAG: murein L,D-transpeptidase [Silicimonas sp.]|nr:murein L,D-transpeptidase [Silicimonas sp.]
MKKLSALFTFALVALLAVLAYLAQDTRRQGPRDIAEIRTRLTPVLTRDLARKGLAFGAPVHLRIFKEEAVLELWVRDGARFALFRRYDICNFSGGLGPKLKEGDRQSPEGFYQVGRNALNPQSRFHLSFNLGFPNAFDRAHGRTGSFLMVHGACASIGCYAMTDKKIEEIYLLVEAALRGGQAAVPVHAFPFRMTEARLAQETGHRWHGFWSDLKRGYDAFEATGLPPDITVSGGRYRVAEG